MKLVPNTPEQVDRVLQNAEIRLRYQPVLDERLQRACAALRLHDPLHRMHVAQAAGRLLHIRFEHLRVHAVLRATLHHLIDLAEHESSSALGHESLFELAYEMVERRLEAGEKSRVDHRGTADIVLRGEIERIAHRPSRMAEIEVQVP